MNVQNPAQGLGKARESGEEFRGVGLVAILFAETELFIDEGDRGFFAQVLEPLKIPASTNTISRVPPERQVGPQDRQSGAGDLMGRVRISQELSRIIAQTGTFG